MGYKSIGIVVWPDVEVESISLREYILHNGIASTKRFRFAIPAEAPPGGETSPYPFSLLSTLAVCILSSALGLYVVGTRF